MRGVHNESNEKLLTVMLEQKRCVHLSKRAVRVSTVRPDARSVLEVPDPTPQILAIKQLLVTGLLQPEIRQRCRARFGSPKLHGAAAEMPVEHSREMERVIIAHLGGDALDHLGCGEKQSRRVIEFSASEFRVRRGFGVALKKPAEVAGIYPRGSAEFIQAFDIREVLIEDLPASLPGAERHGFRDCFRGGNLCRFI